MSSARNSLCNNRGSPRSAHAKTPSWHVELPRAVASGRAMNEEVRARIGLVENLVAGRHRFVGGDGEAALGGAAKMVRQRADAGDGKRDFVVVLPGGGFAPRGRRRQTRRFPPKARRPSSDLVGRLGLDFSGAKTGADELDGIREIHDHVGGERCADSVGSCAPVSTLQLWTGSPPP